jgi:hypothetical protein
MSPSIECSARYADNIPDQRRDTFERYGEAVIALVLSGGFDPNAITANSSGAAASYNAGPELKEFVNRNPVAPGRHST